MLVDGDRSQGGAIGHVDGAEARAGEVAQLAGDAVDGLLGLVVGQVGERQGGLDERVGVAEDAAARDAGADVVVAWDHVADHLVSEMDATGPPRPLAGAAAPKRSAKR